MRNTINICVSFHKKVCCVAYPWWFDPVSAKSQFTFSMRQNIRPYVLLIFAGLLFLTILFFVDDADQFRIKNSTPELLYQVVGGIEKTVQKRRVEL
jgi:hypothetical protein